MSSHLLSLYIHIPFCSTRCGYCHFNTYEGLERLFEPYTMALCSEIERYAQALRDRWRVHTIFIGGGTPTYLPCDDFERIMRTLRKYWDWTEDCEITAESNPSSITQTYLERLRAVGVNRISFGAQAFDAALLQMLDREHSVAQIGDAVQLARRVGFDNVSLDLMYGLPRQTLTQWQDSLEAAIALQVEHLSLYGLTIDEGTAFKKRVQQKSLPEPDDDLAADMYIWAEERLALAGFQQYEISNWAKARKAPLASARSSTLWASRHNLTYWLNEPYIGLGPGAHSFFDHERFWNLNAPQIYIEKIRRGESVIASREAIDVRMEQAETAILNLRLNEGLSCSAFLQRFGMAPDEVFGATLQQCMAWGLLTAEGDCVRLTQRGRLLSNEVFQRLLPD